MDAAALADHQLLAREMAAAVEAGLLPAVMSLALAPALMHLLRSLQLARIDPG